MIWYQNLKIWTAADAKTLNLCDNQVYTGEPCERVAEKNEGSCVVLDLVGPYHDSW